MLDLNFIHSIDKFVFDVVHSTRNIVLNYFFVLITYLGETITVVALCAIAVFIPKNQKITIPVVLLMILGALSNHLFKDFVERARPIGVFLENPPFNYPFPKSYSFPSGHSQNGFLFYFTIIYVFTTKYFKNNRKKIMIISTIIISLIPFSRIYIGVHFFTDVVVGTLLGILFSLWFIYFFNKYENKLCSNGVKNESN
jgi:undecaprenyl-diphosphatase